MKVAMFLILFTVIGLVVGYLIFGQINNKYVDPLQFFVPRSGISGFAVNQLYGLEEKRNSILITGAVGAVVGLFLGVLSRNNKRTE